MIITDLTLVNKKFREVILYISRKCETDPKFSMTKLNKILFYSDFIHYARTGSSITGQQYQKLEFGPAPRAMKPICDQMEASRELAITPREYYGLIQNKPIALREPEIDVLSAREISIIDSVIEKVWRFSANQISSISHGFIGWQIADIGETIPYGLAWIETEPEFSEEERRAIAESKPLTLDEKQQLAH